MLIILDGRSTSRFLPALRPFSYLSRYCSAKAQSTPALNSQVLLEQLLGMKHSPLPSLQKLPHLPITQLKIPILTPHLPLRWFPPTESSQQPPPNTQGEQQYSQSLPKPRNQLPHPLPAHIPLYLLHIPPLLQRPRPLIAPPRHLLSVSRILTNVVSRYH